MPDEKMTFLKQKHLMTSDEIFELSKIFVDLGVKKIRLTGGEPTIRKDFGEIVDKISVLPVKTGITTNGLLIDKYLDTIIKANISSINISIDSLKKEKFKTITQRDHFDKVWENIQLCLAHNIHVKLNMVVMKGSNEDEIFDFVNLTKEWPVHVRFIEFMPFDQNNWNKAKVFSNEEAIQMVGDHYPMFKLRDGINDTDKKFGIFGHAGTLCFISTLTDAFCSTCNRMRITADGKMKNCLFGKDETDIITPFRNGENIIPIIENVVMNKHKKLGGQFEDYKLVDADALENRSMIKIGG